MYEIEVETSESFIMRYKDASIDFMHVDDDGADLYSLWSNERGRGEASKLMDYVCDVADMMGWELRLWAYSCRCDDPVFEDKTMLTQVDLVSFYERKGFVFESDDKGAKGVRNPTKKTKVKSPIDYFIEYRETELINN